MVVGMHAHLYLLIIGLTSFPGDADVLHAVHTYLYNTAAAGGRQAQDPRKNPQSSLPGEGVRDT